MLQQETIKWLYAFVGMCATGLALYIWDKIKWGHGLMSKEKKRLFLKEVHDNIEKVEEEARERDIELENKINEIANDLSVIKEALFDQRYEQLVEISEKYIKNNYIRPDDLKAYQDRVAVYHKLGVNGRLDPWIEKVINLPNVKQN